MLSRYIVIHHYGVNRDWINIRQYKHGVFHGYTIYCENTHTMVSKEKWEYGRCTAFYPKHSSVS